jgi:hypothetical protein
MILRTSPRTSGVHHPYIGVHHACPSPPLYPPVRDTHARGLNGPRACHLKGRDRKPAIPANGEHWSERNNAPATSCGRFSSLPGVQLHTGLTERLLGLRQEAA